MPRSGLVLSALAAAAAAAVVVPAVALASPAAAARPAALDLGVTTVLSRNVLPGLARAVDHGAADAGTRMSLVVSLNRPAAAAEDALLAQLYDPASNQYRRFLTPAEIGQRFGVAPAVQTGARQWLTGAGLTVDATGVTGDMVQVHGSVEQVEKAFGVTIDSFTQGSTDFLANLAAPTVPSALGVSTVVGLNTFQKMTPTAETAHGTEASTTAQDTCVGGMCLGATTPTDLHQVYQQPDEYTGKGQSVGVFGDGDTAETIAGLRQFEAKFGLPQVPVTTLVPPGQDPPADDPAGDGEWRIDVQATTGMAPDVSDLRLYFGNDLSDATVLAEFTQWVEDPQGPNQMDASFGECEALPAGLSDALFMVPTVVVPVDVPVVGDPTVGQGLGNVLQVPGDAELKLATMEGRTLFSSTGDTGSSCPVVFASVIGAGNGVANQGVPLTSYPASSPYVTGVGGTVLYLNDTTDEPGTPATRSLEYAWTFGGGGDSLFIPEPDYQQVEPGVNLPCISDASGTADQGGPCRGIADVAAQSGDAVTNGYVIYDGTGAASQGGGTSLSSPLWAGMWARVSQAVDRGATANSSTGFASMAIYPTEQKDGAYARDFFDVSSTDIGSGSIPAANGIYAALPGWDYATGYGTPKIDGLICDIDGAPSGSLATGVDGVCPVTAQAAPAAPVVTTPVTAPVTAPVAAGTLASTGLQAGLPVGAVVLVGGAALVARRRRRA